MTIYRWWRSKVAVIIDSFLENHVAQTPIDTEGPAIDALRRHVASLARVYAAVTASDFIPMVARY